MSAHRVKITCPHGYTVEAGIEAVRRVLHMACCACEYANSPQVEMRSDIEHRIREVAKQ